MKQDKEIKPLIIDQEESLRAAKEALQANYDAMVNMVKERAAGDHRHLTGENKIETDWGLLSLTASYQIAIRSNILEMVQAVNQAISGTFFIVSRCGISPVAKKYFDNQDHGRGGSAPRAPTLEWQARACKWLDDKEKEGGPLKGAPLARACKNAIPLPIGETRLAKFFCQELKRRKHANKVMRIRA